MTYTVSITSQGQISIPAPVRKKLGIAKNSKAIVSIEDGKMLVKPIKDLLDLKGSIKTNKKPLSNETIHEMFTQEIIKKG